MVLSRFEEERISIADITMGNTLIMLRFIRCERY